MPTARRGKVKVAKEMPRSPVTYILGSCPWLPIYKLMLSITQEPTIWVPGLLGNGKTGHPKSPPGKSQVPGRRQEAKTPKVMVRPLGRHARKNRENPIQGIPRQRGGGLGL